MNEIITCPHCQKSFPIDEAGIEAIRRQVRNKEFDKEIEKQLAQQLQLISEKNEKEAELKLSSAVAKKDEEIAQLNIKLEQINSDLKQRNSEFDIAIKEAVSAKENEIVRLNEQINSIKESGTLNTKNEVEKVANQKNEEIAGLKLTIQKLENEVSNSENRAELALSKAVSEEKSKYEDELKNKDKDIILRVLSMYKDPQEREQQIRNISAAFRELADGILPQLRRSRLTINYETIGRSDEQILDQLKADATKLSIEEILYGAALKENPAEAEAVYQLATKVYPNDARAYNNLATLEYAKGNYEAAKTYIEKACSVNANLPEAQANLGMLALQKGDVKTAEQYIASATGANGLAEVLGNLNLAKGNYAQAEQDFADIYSNSAALAQILNKNYASADVTLRYVKQPDAITDYLKAVLFARLGNLDDAAQALRSAVSKDSSLAAYAANDLELAKVKK